MLTAKLASEVIREVNVIIKEKINIMNNKGVIIASTDVKRIGEIHDGARRIIKASLRELIIHYDGEYVGAKRGVNYPIRILGEIVGVLGITGVYQEIESNAQIIKRLIELMILNDHNRIKRQLGETVRNRFLEDWLVGDVKNITRELVARGIELSIDITVPRRFLACTVYTVKQSHTAIEIAADIEKIEDKIIQLNARQDEHNFFLRDRNSLLLLGVSFRKDADIKSYIEKLIDIVEQSEGYKIAIGIDEANGNYLFAKNAYEKAIRANRVCQRTKKWSYRFYNELSMDIFANEVSVTTKKEYINRVFKEFSELEIKESIVLLENYYEEEGSLGKTAERLFLHKNTIQYKLKRIAERTGYDPRSIRHSSLFYNAIFFYRDIMLY